MRFNAVIHTHLKGSLAMRNKFTPQRSLLSSCILAGSLALLSACGGGGADSGGPPATPVTITTQPTDQAATAGANVVFTAAATGESLTYQWQTSTDGGANWRNVAGASAATLELTVVLASQNGTKFRALVTAASGASATSTAVTLTVTPLAAEPSILSQPTGVSVTAGSPASFSVLADGATALSYQWQRDGADIPGATSATYTLASTTASDDGASFRVLIRNSASTVTSDSARLRIEASVALPTIVTQPQSLTGTEGSPVVLSVVAEGSGPFSYQWRKNGVAIPGATLNTYTSPALAVADSGAAYTVVVSNGAGSVTSAAATLTVKHLPAEWLAQPAAASVAQGATATFTAAASGSQPIRYQWQRNGADIAGATSESYTTPASALADDGAMYTVVVSNPANSITSIPVRLTVVPAAVAPTIATGPASISVSQGQTATFSAVAAGTGPFSYQWLRNGVAISGATAASYTTGATTSADNAARFSLRVTNAVSSATSAEAVLTVNAATGGLVGRKWATGQLLDQTDNEVLTGKAAIADNGTVTMAYMQYNGSRWQLFATRGVSNGTGTAPTWTTPAPIDMLGSERYFAGSRYDYFFGVAGSPNGNAVAYWTFSAPCTTTTYRTRPGDCQYVFTSRYLVTTGAWEAPVNAGGFPGDPSDVQINDRGDIAFAAVGGTPATSYPYYVRQAAVAWRAAGDGGFRTQLLTGPVSKHAMAMDNSGNLLVGAELNQNATTDAAAYRGTLAGGFGSAQVLDTRGAAVSSVRPLMGTGGQQMLVWQQNNGSLSSVYAATSSNAASAFAVQDLGITGWQYMHALDSGQMLLVDQRNLKRYRWTAGTWGSAETIPNWQSGFFSGCITARNGDGLCVGNNGSWQSYDATRNVMVQVRSSTSPGDAWVLGFSKSTPFGTPLLSASGVGFISGLYEYDVLPTVTVPAGDGRNVTNLWGFFLK